MLDSEYGSDKINYYRWYKPKFVAKKICEGSPDKGLIDN